MQTGVRSDYIAVPLKQPKKPLILQLNLSSHTREQEQKQFLENV